MKALVYTGPESLELREVADPEPDTAAGEELIRVESVGICGSDMHAYLGHDDRRPAPLILGHEAAGVVVGGASDGRRVTVNPLVSCGRCESCRNGRENLCPQRQIISMAPREGAFAKYLKMPNSNLIEIPAAISFEKASLAEPIACGWHAAVLAKHSLQLPLEECRALVIGGGAIGVGAALSLLAQGVGAVLVVEANALRRELIKAQGELNVIAPESVVPALEFQLVVDCVGYAVTRAQASRVAAPGGVIVHIGLGSGEGGLDVRRMTLQEISFIGSYTYTKADFAEVSEAIFDGSLGKLEWTETRALADGASAFSDIRAGRTAAPKILLKPS